MLCGSKGMYRPAGNCQDILNTQLLDAVCEKDVGTAKRLLNNGASVNIRTDMVVYILRMCGWYIETNCAICSLTLGNDCPDAGMLELLQG